MRRLLGLAASLALLLGLPGLEARADHLERVLGPAEPARDFPPGFLELLPADDQAANLMSPWKDPRVGGWGGGPEACPAGHAKRPPVVLVHGNTEDANFWRAAPYGNGLVENVRTRFLDAGYCPLEVWAISYTGAKGYTTYNDANLRDLSGFVDAVRTYTGAVEVDLVTHSLGVTLARKAMNVDPELRTAVRSFVGIAGANEGTTSCRGSGTARVSHVCVEVEPGSAWLADLNASGRSVADGIDALTIYEGTGTTDQFYLAIDASSPRLDGACNHEIPFTPHLTLARGEPAVGRYIAFLRDGVLPTCA